jgi:dTDP-4-amino-4,6-dideoxygalactose transaminase
MSQVCKSVPMTRPNPPRLSEHARELAAIEASGTYTNFGPMAKRLERELIARIFTTGECVSVCNATLGLMIAIRQVMGGQVSSRRRFALMPSFTFAATAHAALWNGLTPLLCDVDPKTWLPSAAAEEALLQEYGDQIAVVVPYATFGNNLDLAHYDDLHARFGVKVVVDAAASLGSVDANGRAFGDGCSWPIVFSMHATKPFATGEGGVLYCADAERAAELRAMASFGFEQPRVATLPGLNAKMSEVAALTGCLELDAFDGVVAQRAALKQMYCNVLPTWTRQQMRGMRQVHTFESVLLPKEVTGERSNIMAELRERGIGTGTYFSPHLAEQPYFAATSVSGPLTFTRELGARVITLPMYDGMTLEDVRYVADNLLQIAGKKITRAMPSKISAKAPAIGALNGSAAMEQSVQLGLRG